MIDRRDTLKTIAATATLLATVPVAIAAGSPLLWKAFPTPEAGFLRAPVLVTGPTEAVLIDASFTFADSKIVAEAIRASGKRLTTIYIAASDPDFYFGLAPIAAAFPQARILSAPDTVALMRKKAESKIQAWSPKLGDNGPRSVAALIFPQPTEVASLTVDGTSLEIVSAPGLGDRGRYLWVPSLAAVFGGVAVFGGMYPWVADLPTTAQRQAWVEALDGILARKPTIVVPGHMVANWSTDTSGVVFTRDYLLAFEAEAAKAADSGALIAAMKKRYPNAAMEISLVLGAKVAKGEMKWG